MNNKKTTSGYINRYLLGWVTRILIALFIIVTLIFVFFRWTGAITNTPFSWKRPTIQLSYNKSSAPITQRANQLWISAKFKEHHSNIKEASIFVEDEDGKIEGKKQDLSKGSNTYIFNNLSSGKKKVYSHITWSLFGDKTYYLGTGMMNDVASIDVNEKTINNTFVGTSFDMTATNLNSFYTMKDMQDILPKKSYDNIVLYLNKFLFQPWLGKDYSELISSGEEKDKWLNMPLLFNMLINDEHELDVFVNSVKEKGLDALKSFDSNKIFNSFIPQPFISDGKTEGDQKSYNNLAIQKGNHNYEFDQVLLKNHKFINLKDYANKKTNFRIMPLGLAYKINDKGNKTPYIVTSGNSIKSYALGKPEIIIKESGQTPIIFQPNASSPLQAWFYIKSNNFDFIDDPSLKIEIQQVDRKGEGLFDPFIFKGNLSDLESWTVTPGITKYVYELDYDYLKDKNHFNTLDKDGKPLESIYLKSNLEIKYKIPNEKKKQTLSTDFYSDYWKGEETSKILKIDSLSQNKKTSGELNYKKFSDYNDTIHPEWIQIESAEDQPLPIADHFEISWKQAYWKKIPKNDIKVEFKIEEKYNDGTGFYTKNWFTAKGHDDKLPPDEIASTSGKPNPKLESWALRTSDVVNQYDEEDNLQVEDSKLSLDHSLVDKDGKPLPYDPQKAKLMFLSANCNLQMRIVGKSVITDFWDEEALPIEGEDQIFILNENKGFWLYDYSVDDDTTNEH